MKNSKFVKLILVVLIGTMLLSIATSVLAVDDGYQEIDLNTLTKVNNTLDTNELRSSGTPTTVNTSNTSNTNNTLNTYANTNLPHSGLADSSLPIVALIIIFGISAAYPYKKVQDYKSL